MPIGSVRIFSRSWGFAARSFNSPAPTCRVSGRVSGAFAAASATWVSLIALPPLSELPAPTIGRPRRRTKGRPRTGASHPGAIHPRTAPAPVALDPPGADVAKPVDAADLKSRSEEHTSELQSL